MQRIEIHWKGWKSSARSGNPLQGVEIQCKEWKSNARSGKPMQGMEIHCKEWKSTARNGNPLQGVEIQCKELKSIARNIPLEGHTIIGAKSWAVLWVFPSSVPCKQCHMHQCNYQGSSYLGHRDLSPQQVGAILRNLRYKWLANSNNFFRKNCCLFS